MSPNKLILAVMAALLSTAQTARLKRGRAGGLSNRWVWSSDDEYGDPFEWHENLIGDDLFGWGTERPIPMSANKRQQADMLEERLQAMMSDPNVQAQLQALMADPEYQAQMNEYLEQILSDPRLQEELDAMWADPNSRQQLEALEEYMQNPSAQRGAPGGGLDAPAHGEEDEEGGPGAEGGGSALEEFTHDLTQAAKDDKLDPLIGREAEVRRAMMILSRRTKNNPVLIGDPGVGKTAIAEGIAQLIVDGKAPDRLKGKRVLSLNMGVLVADTKYRGEFEERLKNVIDEIKKSDDVILFIDELHTLIGAGGGEGSSDAANILKPSLARGELQCIGATTITEYRRHIEKDAALERRFQPVRVDEPTIEESLEIITKLAPRYAEFHSVQYTPEALEAAVKLGARYVPDRLLPDKAIDLMDEAGSVVEMEAKSTEKNSAMPTVDVEGIAKVVSQWTGIPVSQLDSEQSKKLLMLEATLHKRVIGQDFAVSAISRALRRARAGLGSPKRPVASMFFCGPTGVGKTELAKAVAESYYGSEKAIVRLDMSEYMEAHSVSRLTGPPPGYVGYDSGGQLTEAVRRAPHTIVLFDEVEKAHPDVFNVLLQILDDGRLTDNKGRVVDFTNTMIVLTSNVGSRMILDMAEKATGDQAQRSAQYSKMQAAVKDELSKKFRPEFLNRLDEIIVFEGLGSEEIHSIANLLLKELVTRVAEQEIELTISQKLIDAVVEAGSSARFGARPLRRAVQRMIEDAVAEAVLDGFVIGDEKLKLDYDGEGGVILTNQAGKQRTRVPPASQGIEDDALEDEAADPADLDALQEQAKNLGAM
jgi:ATP-dependent Clp protease ATP-binding subunit ClpC